MIKTYAALEVKGKPEPPMPFSVKLPWGRLFEVAIEPEPQVA